MAALISPSCRIKTHTDGKRFQRSSVKITTAQETLIQCKALPKTSLKTQQPLRGVELFLRTLATKVTNTLFSLGTGYFTKKSCVLIFFLPSDEMLTTPEHKTWFYITRELVNFLFSQVTQKQCSVKNFSDN